MKRVLLVVAVACAAAWIGAARPSAEDADARARRVHKEAIVIDSHIDTTEMLSHAGWKFDERHQAPTPGTWGGGNHVDLPRMREGGLDAAFFSVYVPGTVTGPPAVKAALEEFDRLLALVGSHPADLVLCRTAAEVRTAHVRGQIGVLIGVEGGSMINDDLKVLDDYAAKGARYMTLTHVVNVTWADSSGDTPKANGLSPFGKDVVREMNRLGMLVDVSHASDKTFWDVLALSRAPVIASHSSCRALCGHPRNLSDEMITALAAKGGIVQINFMGGYLDEALYQAEKQREPEIERLRAELAQKYPGPENEQKRREEGMALYRKMPPLPAASWERIVDHIDHVVKLVGPDHVGLGSDFDGASMPAGMEDCTKLPKITDALLRKGYRESDVKKILGGNLLRVLEKAEDVSRQLRATH